MRKHQDDGGPQEPLGPSNELTEAVEKLLTLSNRVDELSEIVSRLGVATEENFARLTRHQEEFQSFVQRRLEETDQGLLRIVDEQQLLAAQPSGPASQKLSNEVREAERNFLRLAQGLGFSRLGGGLVGPQDLLDAASPNQRPDFPERAGTAHLPAYEPVPPDYKAQRN